MPHVLDFPHWPAFKTRKAQYMDADECVNAKKKFFDSARVVPDFLVDGHIYGSFVNMDNI